nr:g-type lectin s-receptor-like serine/threonine-protein kinase sd2-5 [Quercus suber]
MHLLDLFRKNIEEDQLLDLVDKYSEDMQLHRAEVVSMLRVAAWCLQNDFTRRPSMSMVVKVLEGDVNVESDLDYFFSNPSLPNMRAGVENQEVHIVTTTPLLPSVLSGPRKEHSDFSLSHLYCFIIELQNSFTQPILSQKKPIRTPSSSSPIATLHLDVGDASDTGVASDSDDLHAGDASACTVAKPNLTVADPRLTVADPCLTVANPLFTVADPPRLTVADPLHSFQLTTVRDGSARRPFAMVQLVAKLVDGSTRQLFATVQLVAKLVDGSTRQLFATVQLAGRSRRVKFYEFHSKPSRFKSSRILLEENRRKHSPNGHELLSALSTLLLQGRREVPGHWLNTRASSYRLGITKQYLGTRGLNYWSLQGYRTYDFANYELSALTIQPWMLSGDLLYSISILTSGNDKGEEEEDKDAKTKKPIHGVKILEVGFEFCTYR